MRRRLLAIVFSCEMQISVLALLLLAQSALWGQELRFEARGPAILDRVVLLSEGRFTPEAIRTLAQHFVQENHGQYLFRLTVACSEEDLRLSFFGRREQQYKEVIETLSKVELPRRPMAQLVGLRQGAVLRYRDASGITEQVMGDRADPTLFREGQSQFKLLHFYLNDAEKMAPSARFSLQIYMEVKGPMSVVACAAVTKRIIRDSGLNNVSVAFRSDPWFLENDRFPLVYWFVPEVKMPSELTYLTARSLKCSVSMGVPFGCGGNNFVP